MITKDLGAVTAYAEAVEAGYTGTEEEYAALLASYATVAQQAAASASAAAGSATSAAASATEASTTVSVAIANIEAAGTAQVGLVTAEGTTQVGLVSAEGAAQVSAVDAKGAEVIESIPEDYTELSADVTQLKSDLSGLDTIDNNAALAAVRKNSVLKPCNVFNKNNTVGGRLTPTGSIEANASYITTNYYIPITAGDVVKTSNSNRYVVFYNSSLQMVGSRDAGNTSVTAPANSAYFRISPSASSVDTFMAFINADIPGTYYGFGDGAAVDFNVNLDKLETEIQDLRNSITSITPDKVDFLTPVRSENLFDRSTAVTGRLNNDGTVDGTNTGYFTTDFIDISWVNSSYYIVPCLSTTNIGCNGYAFYNKSKAFISGSSVSSATAKTIPENAAYVRFSYGIGNLSSFTVVANANGEGSNKKIYYSNYEADKNVVPYTWYAGKKASALGDSITANGNIYGTTHSGWKSYVAQEMMFAGEIYNCGIGGTRVSGTGANAMWQDVRINAIPDDTQVLFFNGGMNDWIASATLGDEDSSDIDTFYGALNVIVGKLMTRVPNALIVFMTTTFGYRDGSTKNSANLTTYDYGRAIKKVAEKNGFLCVDLHALSGINQYNMATYINNDGTAEDPLYIHPNLASGAKLTTAISSVLKAYQPVVVS